MQSNNKIIPIKGNESKFYDNVTEKSKYLSNDLREVLKNESDIKNDPVYSASKYPNFIVAINNRKSDGYFESDEITVRIWGQGYDREAQTPVQGGRMKINLHFFAVEDE